jgi:hypothetical protein
MSAVISLRPHAPGPDHAAVIDGLAAELGRTPNHGDDGTWEFRFAGSYDDAHAAVVDALAAVDPAWPVHLTLEYALAV